MNKGVRKTLVKKNYLATSLEIYYKTFKHKSAEKTETVVVHIGSIVFFFFFYYFVIKI